MIPIRTSVEVDEIPGAVIGLIIANVAVFLVQSGLPESLAEAFVYQNALVPARYTQPGFADALGLDPGNYLPLLTNTFMHAGWLHLIVNMWTLWLFGRPLEERLGPLRFIGLYLVCGAVASLAHFVFNLDSAVPALGASGAIAGILGGFTLLYPRAKVVLLTPVLFFPVAVPLPAVVYTALWFVIQIVGGIAAFAAPQDAGGIAWWAHIGGFLAGLALIRPVGAPQRTARRVGASRGPVREIGVQRAGVMRVGPERPRLQMVGAPRARQIQLSTPPRTRRPAQTRGSSVPTPRTGEVPETRATVIDRPQEIDRGSVAYRLRRAVSRVRSEIENAGAEMEPTKTAPEATPNTERRRPWG